MIRKLFLLGAMFVIGSIAYGQTLSVSAPSPADAIRALDKEWLTAQ